ncbi:MAG: hypothetical protein N3B14_00290 [Thermoleophilia bacterium]|nr:hypothetical protein [Thermoleophilia bacterium]
MSKKMYERAITSWPEEDRPRQKLLKYGAHTLSNAELLAILIRTGVEGSTAVDLGRELLRRFKTLRALSACDPAQLREIKGLSTAKIAQIKAAVELGRRMMSEERALEGPIRSSSAAADYQVPLMRDLKPEVVKVVLLDRRKSVPTNRQRYAGANWQSLPRAVPAGAARTHPLEFVTSAYRSARHLGKRIYARLRTKGRLVEEPPSSSLNNATWPTAIMSRPGNWPKAARAPRAKCWALGGTSRKRVLPKTSD